MSNNGLDNLVVLHFISNNDGPQVLDAIEAIKKYPDLSIDLKDQRWSWRELFHNIKIGSGRYMGTLKEKGVMGVYDRRDTNQLNSMVIQASIIHHNIQKRSPHQYQIPRGKMPVES